MTVATRLTCKCGLVGLRVEGKPILSTECLCSDCQQAGSVFQSLPGAPSTLDDRRATRFVLYRKDRVHCEAGGDLLREHRLTADSKTRRVIASCCNTPIFLDFTQGHWLSVYGNLWPSDAIPPLQLRTATGDAPASIALPDDVPNASGHGFGFFAKLMLAWAAMGFRRPRIDYVKGALKT
ncbi:hypothetical protein [uncultured Nitratireductor sp.]|uniref:GFA family protein n=1 Tax=uncultured Nitratireductor sp. TaxID=520953 RepID=UPI0025FA79E2|nr:hypothetical protein [uncultured Nitratireductor sp.]